MKTQTSPSMELGAPCKPITRKLEAVFDAMLRAPTPEERAHLAVEFRAAFEGLCSTGRTNVRSLESGHFCERGPAIQAFVCHMQGSLISPCQNTRLAAIAAFAALITTDSESVQAKTQRTANAMRLLYSTPTTDIPTARAASHLVADFSDLKSPLSDRCVESALFQAMTVLITANLAEAHPCPQVSICKARAAMVITELTACQNVHPAILENQERLRFSLWLVVWDRDPAVRVEGVRSMHAILRNLIVRSEKAVAVAAINDAVSVIRHTLRQHPDSDPCRTLFPHQVKDIATIHGSLVMLASLLRIQEAKAFMLVFTTELCDFALPYQRCEDSQVRHAVYDVLPLVAQLDSEQFAVTFLETVHTATLKIARDTSYPGKERGRSLASLGEIAKQMPKGVDITHLLTDVLKECRKSLAHNSESGDQLSRLPQADVISTISHVTTANRGSRVLEKELVAGLLSGLFRCNFTNELVIALDNIGRAVPVLASTIRSRLVHLIAFTLNSRLPSRTYGVPPSDHSICKYIENSSSSEKIADARLVRMSSSQEFFHQVPISEQLHRADSSTVLAFKSGAISLEGLLKGGRRAQSALQTYPLGDASSLVVEDDVGTDEENSPCVALKAIVIYEFTGMKAPDLCYLSDEFVIGYVEHKRVKVRALAIAASAKLMVGAVCCSIQECNQLISNIQSTLSQFLSVAAADPSTDVRIVAIRALSNPVFYPYLVQPEMLAKLFICFYDRSLAMREAALSLAGRLGRENPAYIIPSMRRYFMHLMRVLKCEGDWFASDRREASELIYSLVCNGRDMVLPYTSALVHVLQVQLVEAKHTNDTSLALPALLTIAEIGGTMSRADLKPYQGDMMPILVDSVLDQQGADPLYRKAALRALTSFVQNTGLAIKPYSEYPALLPELMQLLKSENDASIRILAQRLLGTLGAVDPVANKYVSISDYYRQDVRSNTRTAGEDATMVTDVEMKPSSVELKGYQDTETASADGERPSLTWFEKGEIELSKKAARYDPCWDASFFPQDSLVASLGHASTASPQYFPSVALDSLHAIIAEPRLHLQHREASLAIVSILKSLGPKCSEYLAATVPRLLLLLVHSAPKDPLHPGTFSQLQQHVMQRLQDIVGIAKLSFMPFAFDTVLLICRYLHTARDSVGCITSVCSLLSKLCMALGDEFQPVLATITPLLLCALLQDSTSNGLITKVVLRTLESFGVLLEDYTEIILISLSKCLLTERPVAVREEVLKTIVLLLNDMHSSRLISGVVHPLLHVLAGTTNASYLQSHFKKHGEKDRLTSEQGSEKSDDARLVPLAAIALTITGTRAERDFKVFVPIVAKALRASNLRDQDNDSYSRLKALLMQYSPVVVDDLFPEEVGEDMACGSVLPGANFRVLSRRMNAELQAGIDGTEACSPTGMRFNRTNTEPSMAVNPTRVHMAEDTLLAKWDIRFNSCPGDWVTWMDSLGTAMFAHSGSPIFRACARMAEMSASFTKELFNAVFLSCWSALSDSSTRMKICDNLERAISSETIPVHVIQTILNLFEYMDCDESPVIVCSKKLA